MNRKTIARLPLGVVGLSAIALLANCGAGRASGGEAEGGPGLVAHNQAEFEALTRSAPPGATVRLAPGIYPLLEVSRTFERPLTVTSADPRNRAVANFISVVDAGGVRFEHLDVRTKTTAVRLQRARRVVLDDLNIRGDPSAIAQAPPAILIRDSQDVAVLNSDISQEGTGVGQVGNDGVLIKNNVIHDVWVDGVDGGGSSHVTITGNRFSDFHPAPGAHPDAIQFWTSFTAESAHDIQITDNVFVRGDGEVTQGVFMGNENNIPYRDVTISGNAIIGGMYNGIYVETADKVRISDNLVVGYKDMVSWIFLHGATRAVVEDNLANTFKDTENPHESNRRNRVIDTVAKGDMAVFERWRVDPARRRADSAAADARPAR